MIRAFKPEDVIFIEQIGTVLDSNYRFKMNPYTRCFVYEDKAIVLGFVIFSIMYEKAEIIDIAVNPNYRGQKIGTSLLSSVIQECLASHCESISLEVRIYNREAISFYKKNGFKEASTRKSYYHDDEDALVMVKLVI